MNTESKFALILYGAVSGVQFIWFFFDLGNGETTISWGRPINYLFPSYMILSVMFTDWIGRD